MKKTLLIYILLLSFFSANAQISFSPNPLGVSGDATEFEHVAEFHVTQDNSTSMTLYWSLEKTDFIAEWSTNVCDQITCYGPNSDVSDATAGNILKKGISYLWSFHLKPNGVAGVDTVILQLYDDPNHTNIVASIPLFIDVSVTGTDDIGLLSNNLQLFPNPTRDYFKVLEDVDVRKISIYNIVGKKMKEEEHIQGQSHDMNDLQRGMYLVRLLGENDKMLKVIRMTKK